MITIEKGAMGTKHLDWNEETLQPIIDFWALLYINQTNQSSLNTPLFSLYNSYLVLISKFDTKP